ncbi:ribosomal protein S18-alanine N-acetyltransferase [Clostridiales bacterium BAD-6]|uniref:[Ribosomal protein bS18]-alanine N-acetyltransferase n=2 Tax=Sinanaerobacter chloroacetimidivorans TaxID=2818044 RepID=A0A8J8B1S9_9FIRM|nr:ribosomal protein S18-alanine N-acetyltransferase [Sinanaerobacter chloroacetimidivorans]
MVRQAEAGDVKTIAELDKICFSAPWSESSFEKEIKENQLAFYIVAEIDHCIVGYAGLWRIIDEGHITNVAVHPDFRQKGIGEALVSVLLDHTQREGIRSHTLEVRASNFAAISLYTKLGFVNVGYRKNYYEDNGEDAIIMWRTE